MKKISNQEIKKSQSYVKQNHEEIDENDPEQPIKYTKQSEKKLMEESSISVILPDAELEVPDTLDYSGHKSSENDEETDEDSQEKVRDPSWNIILFAILNPLNIYALLGLLWSIPHLNLPICIEKFVNYLEISDHATGLTCIGVFL